MKHSIRAVTTVSAIALLLTGCATGSERRLAMKKGPMMNDIYHGQTTGEALERSQPTGRGTGDLSGYTREADNEISQLFPVVDNPTIHIYVYPHLRGELPVPGYTTAVPLYDAAVIYALPGEVAQ